MIDFLDLQNRQRLHDQHYHADIDTLNTRDALHHFGEHLTKYLGRMLEANPFDLSAHVESKTLVDSFIIAMGIANRLNVNLSEQLKVHRYTELPFVVCFAIFNGRRATASEKLDHLEDYDFRKEMVDAVSTLAAILVAQCNIQSIDLELEIEQRWAGMESKSFLPKPRTPLKRLTETSTN